MLASAYEYTVCTGPSVEPLFLSSVLSPLILVRQVNHYPTAVGSPAATAVSSGSVQYRP